MYRRFYTVQSARETASQALLVPRVILDPGVLVKLIPPKVFLFSPTLVPPPAANVNSGAWLRGYNSWVEVCAMSSSQFTRITGKTPKLRINSRDWPSGTGKCCIVSVAGNMGVIVGWSG